MLINGRCQLPGIERCLPPKRIIRGRCRLPELVRCQPPRVWRGGRCILPNPACRAPRVRSPITGRCYLPFDVVPIPEAQCRPPWVYSARAGGCVKLRPRPKPRENITWIHSCLNRLGYRAGFEDGLAGRQTRTAWDSFRNAMGLNGYIGYGDPETLAQLYRQCAPAQEAVAPPPPPRCPDPKISVGKNCASGLNYRPSLCATGRLFSTLSQSYGQTLNLEKCGRSCLPVPEGMDEAEALRLQSGQGINWCKDCIKVGDEGILCPTPRPLRLQ